MRYLITFACYGARLQPLWQNGEKCSRNPMGSIQPAGQWYWRPSTSGAEPMTLFVADEL